MPQNNQGDDQNNELNGVDLDKDMPLEEAQTEEVAGGMMGQVFEQDHTGIMKNQDKRRERRDRRRAERRGPQKP